mgnify:CR=1 FL=1
MSEDSKEKSALVPRRRFPEFREEWASSPTSELYSFKGNNSLSRDKLNYTGGSFRNIHYGDIHTKFAPHFRVDAESVPYINDGESHSTIRPENYCMAGDMVFADASEDLADIGKAIEIIEAGDVPLVSGLHTILARPNGAPLAVGFGAYLFSSEGVRKQIQREAQGAKVLGLSATRLRNVKLPHPRQTAEQQKIADCLSSLDELIAAEANKLDALKTHKKGLMQQLFPAEGETVPRLRFPEFREAGEWETYSLGCFIEEYREKSSSQDEYEVLTSARNGLIRQRDYYDNDRITERDNVGFNVIPPNYLTYRSRSDDRRFYFNENNLGVTGIISTYYPVFRINGGSNKFFIELLSHYVELVGKYSVGTSQTVLSLNEVRRIKLPIPKEPEQQKIADCLSALDDLIAAQAQKIEQLKRHKKGLMQQLFPVLG